MMKVDDVQYTRIALDMIATVVKVDPARRSHAQRTLAQRVPAPSPIAR